MVLSNPKWGVTLFSALILMGLLQVSVAFAPPEPPAPVVLDQPFAAIMFGQPGDPELLLSQSGSDYKGCVSLKLVNNIPINIWASVAPSEYSGLPNAWSVKLNEPGENEAYRVGSTRNRIGNLYAPGSPGDLELCVVVHGVSPQWHGRHEGMTKVRVAQVTLTIMPDF